MCASGAIRSLSASQLWALTQHAHSVLVSLYNSILQHACCLQPSLQFKPNEAP